MQRIEEGYVRGSVNLITKDKTEIILEQMKNCVCEVIGNKIGSGFFCRISYENKLIPVLITNYHIMDDTFLEKNKHLVISINEKKITKKIAIDKNRKLYSSKDNEYDVMIIKLKEEDEINNYLELDQNLFNEGSEISYENTSIYILHYTNGNKVSVSYGYGLEKDANGDFDFMHKCHTEFGSSGGPILNLSNNKVIGIHKGTIRGAENNIIYNISSLLKFPLMKLNEKKINKENEIKLKIKINKEDINKNIYFLDNTNGVKDSKGIKHYHDLLKELDKTNTKIYINDKEYEYQKFFIPKNEGIYSIIIKFNISIKDCSFMFYDCYKLTEINFTYFNTENITNMENMFGKCENLKSIDLSSFDTKNVVNLSHLFERCENLEYVNLSSFDTKNVTNMEYMFSSCKNLKNIDISSFDTKKVVNMGHMFEKCENLKEIILPNSFDTRNVTNMEWMFNRCYNLENIDLSSFNTQNVKNAQCMFAFCKKLKNVDLSGFNTVNISNMEFMFVNCDNLNEIKIKKESYEKIRKNETMLNNNIKTIFL